MADTTPSLALPLIAGGQAQKHVTHNEALALLDALVQLAVIDKDLAAPPANPAEGDRYIVAADPSGAWAGWAGRIARYQDGAWLSLAPRPGWLAFVADEAEIYTFVGGAWIAFRSTFTALQNLTRLGLGTAADAQNPFAAKLNKALWTALTTSEGGTGDLRYTLNKQAAGNVLSLLLQTGFAGRAEIGLVGSDNLGLRVSPDGSTWLSVFSVERTTGVATFDRGTLREEVTVVTATGTWTKPDWAREVDFVVIGGGGGGGSGRRGAAGSGRGGGGGGGAGGLGYSSNGFAATELAGTLSIEVGAGGSGGAGVTTDNTNGNPGGNGGNSRVLSGGAVFINAGGGQGGSAGTNGNASGGLAGGTITLDIGNGNGGAGAAGPGGGAQNGLQGAAGAGGGGGLTAGDVSGNGGNGGFSCLTGRVTNFLVGGVAPGGNGAAGNAKPWSRGFGGAGSGGAAGNAAGTVAGGNGGAGAPCGGPGGGGGGSTNGANSGAGGAGARGEVWIIARG